MTRAVGRCCDCSAYDPPNVGDFGQCSRLSRTGDDRNDTGALAFASGVDSYDAALCVHPEFGCVHFTRRDHTASLG